MASGPITSWQICVCWVMSDSVTPWTVALQAPLSMGFPRKECWTALSYSRGSFWPKGWTRVSYILCIDRWILYQLGYLGSQIDGGKVKYFIFLGSKITHEIKGHLLLGRKVLTKIFPCSSVGKDSSCNAGDLDSIPGSGRSSGEGNGNPLQYCCL